MIGLCSWQREFRHGTFNAGLAHVVSHAFPTHPATFHVEQSHVPFLRDALSLSRSKPGNSIEVVGHDLGAPRTAHGSLQRFKLLFKMVQAMRRPDVACWVFADMGGSALTFLRYLMRLGRVTTPVVVIAHALFEPLGWNSRPLPERLPGLRGPHLPNLRLVVLEEHITTALARNFPSLLRQHDIRLLPIPLLDVEYACTQPVDAHHFVFPGVPDKGLATFAELAREVHAVQPQANFSVAGFVSGNEDASATAHLTDTPGSPLSIPEYFRRLAAASYTMWFSVHDPNPYQYRTSGTIPDLIACGKPTLFVRNSMVDCYFRRYGAIGYNCDSWPALVQRVKEMCMVNPPVIPAEQHAAVERAREALLPRTLGPVFRDIVLGQKRASSD